MSDDRKNNQILTKWVSEQRGRPQYRAAPSAGMAVSRVLRPLSKTYGGGSSALTLEKVWPDIMGPRWSKISTPVRFIGGRSGRTLVISAPGAAAAMILAQSGPILERLNTHLGAGHVTRLKLVQSRMTAPPQTKPMRGLSPTQEKDLREGLSNIENDALKQALNKLGRGVISREN